MKQKAIRYMLVHLRLLLIDNSNIVHWTATNRIKLEQRTKLLNRLGKENHSDDNSHCEAMNVSWDFEF